MLNPSYLIKSRHDIYYFRYPLPASQCGEAKRISISLKTRCPKEALRLAKALEYHSVILNKGMDLNYMNHAEIMSLLKDHYSEVLDRSKAQIDVNGTFSKEKTEGIENYIKQLDVMIANDSDSIQELIDGEASAEDSIHDDLKGITDKYELELDSKEYEMMKKAYKHVRRNHFIDLLSYNSQVFDYSLLSNNSNKSKAIANHYKPENKLQFIVTAHLDEIKPNLTKRSFNEQRDCLHYLIDWLGKDYPITKIDNEIAQQAKKHLRGTPLGRNKGKLTRDHSLLEQIAITKEHRLDTLSSASVNKYLTYFDGLFKWSQSNRYLDENPFTGIRVKDNKKGNRRDMFKKDEVALILEELAANKSGKIKNKSQYWGTLIAIYTGARRNEICALLADDIKQDKDTGIWYFDITDEEEEGKDVKTDAANRVVPIHSRLIDLGILDFLEESHRMKHVIKHKNGYTARFLYDLNYTEHQKWGRKLGQFVNDRLLQYLDIHVKNKKTLHSLRHSFITNLSAAKVESPTIKSMVGHEQGTVTAQVYTHYGIDFLSAFQEDIEKLPY
jgi:integrase